MKKLSPQQVEERISDQFTLPKDIIMGMVRITMMGNCEVILENYKGILFCSQECIKIQTKKQDVCIEGKELEIKYFTEKDMKIKGTISSISFL